MTGVDRTQLRLTLGALAPLTVEELANILGCRPAAIKEIVAKLRPITPGRAKRYLFGEVCAALREVDEAPKKVTVPFRRAKL